MLAHQGGWDEILVVIGPIVVVGGVLAIARRRIVRPPETVETVDAEAAASRSPDPG